MVGIFDSGIGGLTALNALRKDYPLCDIAYFGDTAHLPYGSRSEGTIARYAAAAISTLASLSPEAVLVACGTVSTVCLPELAAGYPFPVYGITEAGTAAALAAAPHGKIAVLGTEATIRAGGFSRRILARRPDAILTCLACPIFVFLAESGMNRPDDPVARLAVLRTLAPLLADPPEAILLGCTHFPWLSGLIAPLFPEATLIDCGAAAARALGRQLRVPAGQGRTRFYITDSAAAFQNAAYAVSGRRPDGEFFEVTPAD